MQLVSKLPTKLSKYEWLNSYISINNVESVLSQLQNGNVYVLTDDEFWIESKPGDMRIHIGYFKDDIAKIHYHKVTNDTRRFIIKTIKIKQIVDQDNERCVKCGSIDCSTCMQLHRDGDNRPGYIVICHSCNHRSNYR